jgi:hypothetical protein
MVLQIQSPNQSEVLYPDSDRQPVANNPVQFRWLVEIQQNRNGEKQKFSANIIRYYTN